MEASPNNRFVFTGGPGVGKTSLIEALSARGFHCVPDVARAIIKARVRAGQSPRPDPKDFAKTIFEADLENYRTASSSEVTFFDRGAVDALGMLAESEAMTSAEIEANLRRYPYHKVVFLFPPWQEIYRTDDERDQTFEESIRVFEAVRGWYFRCGYEPVEVPIGTLDERVNFVERTVSKRSTP